MHLHVVDCSAAIPQPGQIPEFRAHHPTVQPSTMVSHESKFQHQSQGWAASEPRMTDLGRKNMAGNGHPATDRPLQI